MNNKWIEVPKKDGSNITFVKFKKYKTSCKYALRVDVGSGYITEEQVGNYGPYWWSNDEITYRDSQESINRRVEILKKYYGIKE